jgi:hypothetical protein
MHNCKVTRKRLIEQCMDKSPSGQQEIGPAELEECPHCLEELAVIGKLLRVTDQAMDSARPVDSFWTGYHARLRQSLESDTAPRSPSENKAGALVGLRNLFASYVRVPVPVAAVVVLLLGVAGVFGLQSRRLSAGSNSTVVTRTVEVPVVQERLVTQVVYRERGRHLSQDRTNRAQEKQIVAKASTRRNTSIENNPPSLAGFKPANEARLTIIKGSERDDK